MGDVVDFLAARIERGRLPWRVRYRVMRPLPPEVHLVVPGRWGRRSISFSALPDEYEAAVEKARTAFQSMARVEREAVLVLPKNGEYTVQLRRDPWPIGRFQDLLDALTLAGRLRREDTLLEAF